MNIKEKIRDSGIRQWQVAEKLNISEFTLSRWLRHPNRLDQEIINRINKAIKEIKENTIE